MTLSNSTFYQTNMQTLEHHHINISCGIDYGKVLLLDNREIFGTPVNYASKLGEDLGSSGEILLTKEAMHAIPETLKFRSTPVKHTVSNVEIETFQIHYQVNLE